jgi:hypothetical protein
MNRGSATFLGVLGALFALVLILGAPAYSTTSSSNSTGATVRLITPIQQGSLWVALAASALAIVATGVIWWRPRLAGRLLIVLALVMLLAMGLYAFASEAHPAASVEGRLFFLIPGLMVLAAGAIVQRAVRPTRPRSV